MELAKPFESWKTIFFSSPIAELLTFNSLDFKHEKKNVGNHQVFFFHLQPEIFRPDFGSRWKKRIGCFWVVVSHFTFLIKYIILEIRLVRGQMPTVPKYSPVSKSCDPTDVLVHDLRAHLTINSPPGVFTTFTHHTTSNHSITGHLHYCFSTPPWCILPQILSGCCVKNESCQIMLNHVKSYRSLSIIIKLHRIASNCIKVYCIEKIILNQII